MSLVEPDTRPLPGTSSLGTLSWCPCKATIVVQAPVRSGARNAAHAARKLGRLLYVVPSAPWVEKWRGLLLELRLGARPLGAIGDC